VSPVRILGIGSPVAGDDLGWRLAEALERAGLPRYFPAGMVHITLCDRPGSLLLPAMRGARLAILLDAMRSGAPPGTLRRLDMRELDDSTGLLSSHGFGVAEAMALGRALEELPPRVLIYGIETGQTPSLPPLSDLAAILWPAIIGDIQASLGRLVMPYIPLFGGLERATVVEPRGAPGEHHQGGHHPAQGAEVQVLNEVPEGSLPTKFRGQ